MYAHLPLEQAQLFFNMQDCVPAVDDIKKVRAQITRHDICNLEGNLCEEPNFSKCSKTLNGFPLPDFALRLDLSLRNWTSEIDMSGNLEHQGKPGSYLASLGLRSPL